MHEFKHGTDAVIERAIGQLSITTSEPELIRSSVFISGFKGDAVINSLNGKYEPSDRQCGSSWVFEQKVNKNSLLCRVGDCWWLQEASDEGKPRGRAYNEIKPSPPHHSHWLVRPGLYFPVVNGASKSYWWKTRR